MTYVLGIDGGGTNTLCAAADTESGVIVARASAPPSNHRKATLAEVRAALKQGVAEVSRQLATSGHRFNASKANALQFAAVCAGLAGVDTERDRMTLLTLVAEIVATESLLILNDGEIALAGALDDAPGVIAISGTGSIAWARGADGAHYRVGGWDYVFSDEGSGYDIGARILRAVAAAHDGRTAPTALTEKLFAAVGVQSFDALLDLVYHAEMTPQRIAALAPLADDAAVANDIIARELLLAAARDLAQLAADAARVARLNEGNAYPVAELGGALTADGFFARAFRNYLAILAPQLALIEPRHTPVEGALLLALKQFNPAATLNAIDYFSLVEK